MTRRPPPTRSDFAETLFWHPVLVLPDGKADISFDLCDSVTTFQVTAFAHTARRPARRRHVTFDSRLPFTLQPQDADRGDGQRHASTCRSASPTTPARTSAVDVKLKEHDGLDCSRADADELRDRSGEPARQLYRFQPTLKEGEAALTFEGKTGRVRRRHGAQQLPRRAGGLPRRRLAQRRAGRRPRRTTLDAAPRRGSRARSSARSTSTPRRWPTCKRAWKAAPRAERLLRADLDEQLSERADPRLPQGERPGRSRRSRSRPATCCRRGYQKLDLLRVHQSRQKKATRRLRVVRRHRPAARGADRVWPAAVPRHGPRPGSRPGDDPADAGLSAGAARRQGRLQAQRPRPSTPSAGPRAHHQRLHRLGPDRERQATTT